MAKQIDHIIKELRQPFTSEAVQFKIQSAKGRKALIVSYVDARQVCERLNLVCPGQWTDSYRELLTPKGIEGVECRIGIAPSGTGGYYIERSDVGIPEGGIGGLKAVYSDAFKRAGVKWGIGVANYYTPKFFADKEDLRKSGENYYMSDKVLGQARSAYTRWLSDEGIKRFGDPLDMGDTTEAQGDIEVRPEGDHSEEIPDDLFSADVPPAEEEVKRIGVDKVRQSYKGYKLRADEPEAAEKRFALWLNSEGLPSKIEEMTHAQRHQAKAYLDSDGSEGA